MELLDLLSKYKFTKRQQSSSFKIENIEKLVGFKLPDDYKYFIANYNEHEGMSAPNI